jgi:hypothetical protein
MTVKESNHSQKTKIREAIFLAHIEGKMENESVIARLEISERHYFRLKKRFYSKIIYLMAYVLSLLIIQFVQRQKP